MSNLRAIYRMQFNEDVPNLPERDYTDDEIAMAILSNKPLGEGEMYIPKDKGDSNMELEKIKRLLKTYGARDEEIANFIEDLQADENQVDENQADNTESEEDDDYLLNTDTVNKLRSTKEGLQILANAPRTDKEKLKELIKSYLNK